MASFTRSRAAELIKRGPSDADLREEDSAGKATSADLQLARRDREIDLDAAVDDAHRVGVHREHRGKRLDLAGPQVEACAVPGALDEAFLELALAEDATVMRTHVVDRAPGAVVAVAQAEAPRAGLDDLHLAHRDLVRPRDGDEIAHALASSAVGSTPISAMLPMRGRSALSTRWRTCSSASWLMTRRKKPCTSSCCAASRSNPRDMT